MLDHAGSVWAQNTIGFERWTREAFSGVKAIATGPISPRETASVKGDVKQGTYALKVSVDGVRAARIVVGKPRPSSQNQLLQP